VGADVAVPFQEKFRLLSVFADADGDDDDGSLLVKIAKNIWIFWLLSCEQGLDKEI
jgi:hypothetical protein